MQGRRITAGHCGGVEASPGLWGPGRREAGIIGRGFTWPPAQVNRQSEQQAWPGPRRSAEEDMGTDAPRTAQDSANGGPAGPPEQPCACRDSDTQRSTENLLSTPWKWGLLGPESRIWGKRVQG